MGIKNTCFSSSGSNPAATLGVPFGLWYIVNKLRLPHVENDHKFRGALRKVDG